MLLLTGVEIDVQGALVFLWDNIVGWSSQALVDGGRVGCGIALAVATAVHVDPNVLLRLLGVIVVVDGGPRLIDIISCHQIRSSE